MQPSEKTHSIQFLEDQLQDFITLLAKQQLEQSLFQRGPAVNH